MQVAHLPMKLLHGRQEGGRVLYKVLWGGGGNYTKFCVCGGGGEGTIQSFVRGALPEVQLLIIYHFDRYCMVPISYNF